MAFVGVTPASDVAAAAALREALASHPAVALQAADQTLSFLDEAARLDHGCDPSTDRCLLDDAAVCGVALALHAVAQQRDGSYDGSYALRAAVAADGSVRSARVMLANAAPPLRAARLREAIAQLVTPAAVGTLSIEAPSGSSVAVDGVVRGIAPLTEPIHGMAPRAHLVEVTLADGSVDTRRIATTAGRRVHVVVVPPPFLAEALTWTGAGLVVAVLIPAGVGAAFAVKHSAAKRTLDVADSGYLLTERDSDLNDAAEREKVVGAQRDAIEAASIAPMSFLIAAAVAAVGGFSVTAGVAWPQLFGWSVEELE